ncbi:ankyrin [Atractiella rhizophila]|nr:ankyrin [Atractiella rhizophila]
MPPSTSLQSLASTAPATHIRPLLEESTSELYSKDEDGRTPLHYACSNARFDNVQLFLEVAEREERVKELLEIKDDVGWTALHCAASAGGSEVVSELLAAGSDPNATTHRGQTALHYAASKGHLSIGRSLLSKGADVNARDSANQIALHRASSAGATPFVQLLIANKTRLNLADRAGNTPLHLAVESGHAETAVALIEGGADRDRTNSEGQRPEEIDGVGGMEGRRVISYIQSKVGPLE